jgi:hypothetical protein
VTLHTVAPDPIIDTHVMSETFTLPMGLIVVEVSAENNAVSGSGRPEFPILVVPVKMLYRGPKASGAALYFREIRCRVSPFDQTYLAIGSPTRLDVCLASGKELPNQPAYIEIQLDDRRLSLIERLRQGGDVKLRLECEIMVEELFKLGQSKEPFSNEVYGLTKHHRLLGQINVVVPRSVWVERVLPQTGFGQIHILELPVVPIESCASLKGAFDALQQALKLEKQGFYNEAVSKCRFALEPFFEKVEKVGQDGQKIKVPALKSAWQTRLGRATYDWLNASFVAVKDPTNRASHVSSTSFGQLDAQMLLTVATALIAYAVKTECETGS